jgi:hypothetical protein
VQLDQPFCMPFGNRRLLHCQDPRKPDKGEVPAWEACGKVVRKEKQDFYEFVVSGPVWLGFVIFVSSRLVLVSVRLELDLCATVSST